MATVPIHRIYKTYMTYEYYCFSNCAVAQLQDIMVCVKDLKDARSPRELKYTWGPGSWVLGVTCLPKNLKYPK